MELWATGGAYRVTVYREAKNEKGYRKIKEYGGAGRRRAGVLGIKKEGIHSDVGERRI